MTKNNNSLIDEVLESDWKYSAKLIAIVYVAAFWVMPWVLPMFFLQLMQWLAKLIIGVLFIISFAKFLSKNQSSQPNSLYTGGPVVSETLDEKIETIRNKKVFEANKVHASKTQSNPRKTDTHKNQQVNIEERWTEAFINSLDWKVFETLCSQYLHVQGIDNHESKLGADGGVDIFIYDSDTKQPTAIAQCKKWSNPIKLAILREFYGVMHVHNVSKGYFFTTDKFYKTSIEFASKNNIDLIDGGQLVSSLKKLQSEDQESIYKAITKGDYTTPTCVKCDKKMVLRKNPKTHKEFWGCNTYRCRTTMNIKKHPKKRRNSLHY